MKQRKGLRVREAWELRFPLDDLLEGWRFRVEERSAGVYVAEGRDFYGRSVSQTGTDGDALLSACVRDARAFTSE